MRSQDIPGHTFDCNMCPNLARTYGTCSHAVPPPPPCHDDAMHASQKPIIMMPRVGKVYCLLPLFCSQLQLSCISGLHLVCHENKCELVPRSIHSHTVPSVQAAYGELCMANVLLFQSIHSLLACSSDQCFVLHIVLAVSPSSLSYCCLHLHGRSNHGRCPAIALYGAAC